MRFDLRKILDNPGASAQYRVELDPEALLFPSVSGYASAPVSEGCVFNEAGIIRVKGCVSAEMRCICDRCGDEFDSVKETEVDAVLAFEESDDNPDLFIIEDDSIDIEEVVSTCFVLDMETKFLCKEDCKGLCPGCGKNLNHGPCGCRKELDPRFAVLEQLLDK